MDKIFESYWALRITALILAFALFFYAKADMGTNRDIPVSTKTDILYDVPLEVYYDDTNLIVTGLPETVNVMISGPQPIVLQTKNLRDFKVFVNLNSSIIGEHDVTIQHEGFSDKLEVSIEPKSVNVVIEERVAKEFRVDPEMNNRLIAEEYVLDKMTADPATVMVTGAKSVIENISYVKATVTGEPGIKSSFEQEANVKVLNSDLNRLDVGIQPEKVKVKVEIKEYSRDLPITIKPTGEFQEGISLEEISVEPSTLTVYGKKATIDELPELVVEFDVTGLEESGTYETKVRVPDGVTVKENTIKIHANVKKDSAEAASEPAEDESTENELTEGESTENESTEDELTENGTTEDEPTQTEEDSTQ